MTGRDLRACCARQGPLRPAVGDRARQRSPRSGLAPHRATSGTSTTRAGCGSRAGVAHVIRTAAGPVTPVGIEQRVEALDGVRAAAVVGVGPRGPQQVVVVAVPTPRPAPAARRRASLPTRWPRPCARRRGVDRGGGAARRRLPLDIRHASKIDRRRVAAWAERVLAGDGRQPAVKVLVTGATGLLGARRRRAPRRPRRRRHRAAAPPSGARAAARCSATSPTADAVARRAPRPRRGRAPGRQGRRRRPVAGLRPRPTSPAPGPSWRRAGAPGWGGSCRCPRRRSRTPAPRWSGAGADPADPARARGHYARSKAVAELLALAADAAPEASPSSRCARTWSGGRATPSWSAASSPRARAGRLPVIGSRRRADRHHLPRPTRRTPSSPPLDRCAEARGQALVVSNGEPRPVAELLAAICRAAGCPRPAGTPSRRRWRGGQERSSRRCGPLRAAPTIRR